MASIQQSLNSMFAATLGAGFAVSRSPIVEEMVANRALNKERQYLSEETTKAMKGLNKLEFNKEEDIAIAEAAIGATEELSHEVLRQQVKLRQPNAVENYAGRAGVIEGNRLTLKEKAADFVKRQQEAQQQRQEVENAVAERRRIIDELKAMGINPEGAKGITNITTGERIK